MVKKNAVGVRYDLGDVRVRLEKERELYNKYNTERMGLKVVIEELTQHLVAKRVKMVRCDQTTKRYR